MLINLSIPIKIGQYTQNVIHKKGLVPWTSHLRKKVCPMDLHLKIKQCPMPICTGPMPLINIARSLKMNQFATLMLKMKIFVAPPLKMKKIPTYLMKINKFSEQNPPGPPQNIKWSSPKDHSTKVSSQ